LIEKGVLFGVPFFLRTVDPMKSFITARRLPLSCQVSDILRLRQETQMELKMTITQINRAALRIITEEVMVALKTVGDKHGVDLTQAGGKFSNSGTGEIKLKLAVRDNGMGVSGEENRFRQNAPLSGISADAFGKTFMHAGRTYTVAGWKPSSPKYCVMAKDVHGDASFFSATHIAREFRRLAA
jgi:hypothetical protein